MRNVFEIVLFLNSCVNIANCLKDKQFISDNELFLKRQNSKPTITLRNTIIKGHLWFTDIFFEFERLRKVFVANRQKVVL